MDRETCIGYLAHPFDKKALWAVIASLFQSVRETQPPIEEGNRSVSPEKISEYGQPTLKKGIHRLHERAVKGLFRHDATSWMDLISQLTSRIWSTISGCPAVVMVQLTHDWNSDHLLACVMRGKR
jgi:hypothetical protein